MTEIAQICKDYGLSQTALAKRFGIPYRTVQDWHSGRRPTPAYIVGMIRELLDHDRQMTGK
jgi:DNA-binding transcriptional regulator YiaG